MEASVDGFGVLSLAGEDEYLELLFTRELKDALFGPEGVVCRFRSGNIALILEKLGVGVWDPDKVILVSDHYVPAVDAESARILDITRKFAAAQKLT